MNNLLIDTVTSIFSGNVLAMADYSNPSSSFQSSYTTNNASSQNPKKAKNFFKRNKYIPFVIVLLIVAVIGAVGIKNTMQTSSASSPALLGANDKRANVDKPNAQQTLNRNFDFPLRDTQGKEVSKLKYEIQNAELRDEIIVKGQRATSIKGRTFLILNLKITNNYDKSIQLNSKDYVRLIVGSTPEKLAADIHNDPVDVQAISTKFTRLGFPINDNEKSLTLQIGEISGKKETVTLDLK